MSPNNGILFNGVLRSRLFKNLFALCSSINLKFLLLYIPHFDNYIILPFLVFKTFEITFSVFLLHFTQYVSMFYNGYYSAHVLLCFIMVYHIC